MIEMRLGGEQYLNIIKPETQRLDIVSDQWDGLGESCIDQYIPFRCGYEVARQIICAHIIQVTCDAEWVIRFCPLRILR
jgi:hypothetical protein